MTPCSVCGQSEKPVATLGTAKDGNPYSLCLACIQSVPGPIKQGEQAVSETNKLPELPEGCFWAVEEIDPVDGFKRWRRVEVSQLAIGPLPMVSYEPDQPAPQPNADEPRPTTKEERDSIKRRVMLERHVPDDDILRLIADIDRLEQQRDVLLAACKAELVLDDNISHPDFYGVCQCSDLGHRCPSCVRHQIESAVAKAEGK